MRWKKVDKYEYVLHLTKYICIYIGQYYDASKFWYVGLTSDLSQIFNCEKRFSSKEGCKDYVEEKVKRFYKELKDILEKEVNK